MFDGIRAWFKPKPEVLPALPRINDIALLNVARAVLEAPEPEHFDMTVYGRDGKPCCALGHYAMRYDLQNIFAGIGTSSETFVNQYFLISRRTGEAISQFDEDVIDHFGVIPNEMLELFGPCGCNYADTPQEAAQYIYDFVTRRS